MGRLDRVQALQIQLVERACGDKNRQDGEEQKCQARADQSASSNSSFACRK